MRTIARPAEGRSKLSRDFHRPRPRRRRRSRSRSRGINCGKVDRR